MHLPEIDKYAELDSFFHSWDPRVKIVSLIFLIISIAIINSISLAFIGLVVAFGLVLMSRIPFIFVLKQMRWVAFFILFFLIIMPLSVREGDVVRFGFIAFSRKV